MRFTAFLLLSIILPSASRGQQAAPEISISANGGRNINLYPGWPLIVDTTIMNSSRHQDTNPSTLTIAPAAVLWTTAIGFSAVSSSGQTVSWPLTQVGEASESSLTLAKKSYVNATWQMSAADVSVLTPGKYQLTAMIQVNGSGGWNGSVISQPVSITIAPEPALTAAEQSRKSLLLTEFSLNAGDINAAVTITQQLKQDQPQNPSAAMASAGVLATAGYDALALLQASDALSLYYQFDPTPSEAPSDLLFMYQGLLTSLSTSSVPTATSTIAPHSRITFSPNSQTVPLTATVSVAGGAVNGGTVTFTAAGLSGSAVSQPVTGGNAGANFTVPGGSAAASYALKAAYSGTSEFAGSDDASGILLIGMAAPTITWNTPAAVAVGTVLSATQLNAVASVPGTFVYNPPAGTVTNAGAAQTLSVTFIPTDSVDYTSATASVSLSVIAGSYSGSVSPSAARIKVGGSHTFTVNINSTDYVGVVSLGCANPPAGITCSFSTNQVNLVSNGNSTSALTIHVNAKPQSAAFSPFNGFRNIAAATSARQIAQWIGYFLLGLIFLAMSSRNTTARAKSSVPLALTMLLLAVVCLNLNACTSATLSEPGSGGGGSEATAQIVIQGTAGETKENLGTLFITVP